MPWPAQSPDMNPIENLWAIVKSKVAELEPKNIDELKMAIIACWNSIPKSLCQSLALSFLKRRDALIKAKGWHIDY